MFGSLSSFDGDVFDEYKRIEREMERLFSAGPWSSGIRSVDKGSYPPINIGSTPERVDLYLFAAGVNPDSLDLSIQHNLLTIAGERRLIREEGADYYRTERFDGEFRRVVNLPDDVDPERVDARYRDGVLHVTVHRREASIPRQIEVK